MSSVYNDRLTTSMDKHCLRRFIGEDAGQDLAEYAFLLAFIALGTFIGITSLGEAVGGVFQATATSISSGT